MSKVNNYKCEHGRQCKSRCSLCLGHPVNQGKCSRCKDPFVPDQSNQETYNGKPIQTCPKCRKINKCHHDIQVSKCKTCNNEKVRNYRMTYKCEHQIRKDLCKLCNPLQFLINRARSRVYRALGQNKQYKTIEYLGCTIEELKEHIMVQFTEGMSWERMGTEIHIDHKIPIMYNNPTMEEIIKRLHYTNLQPMWARENMSKGNRFISE